MSGDGGHAEALGGPCGDGNITVRADPFRVDDAAKGIVARYVVAAEERAVGHVAPRRGDAPLRIELKFSAALEIGADALVAVGRRRSQRIEPDTRAVGHIGAELEGAELRQLAVTAFEHPDRTSVG